MKIPFKNLKLNQMFEIIFFSIIFFLVRLHIAHLLEIQVSLYTDNDNYKFKLL